jgi:hypothetical protein
MLCYIDNPSGIARKRGEKQVLVNTFGFTKKCFVSVLLGPPKTYQPKHVFLQTKSSTKTHIANQRQK